MALRYKNKKKEYRLIDKESGKCMRYYRNLSNARHEKRRLEKTMYGMKIKIVNLRGVEVG